MLALRTELEGDVEPRGKVASLLQQHPPNKVWILNEHERDTVLRRAVPSVGDAGLAICFARPTDAATWFGQFK